MIKWMHVTISLSISQTFVSRRASHTFIIITFIRYIISVSNIIRFLINGCLCLSFLLLCALYTVYFILCPQIIEIFVGKQLVKDLFIPLKIIIIYYFNHLFYFSIFLGNVWLELWWSQVGKKRKKTWKKKKKIYKNHVQ